MVAPKRVAEYTWPEERDLWRPDLNMAVAVGYPGQRKKALDSKADVTVVSWDNLKDINRSFKTVVLDELSGYKNHGTNRFKFARRLSKHAEYVWGLTGTPTPNGYMDLWAQMFLIDKGERLGTGLGRYRDAYFNAGKRLPNGIVMWWDLKDFADELIKKKIEDIMLSMSAKDHLDLPELVHNVVDVRLPGQVKTAYNEIREELVTNLELLGLGDEIHTAANAAVLTNRLSQITAGFLFSDEQDGTLTWLHDQKIDALRQIKEETGSPLLVFYNYRPELARIKEVFPDAHTLNEKGVMTEWNHGGIPLLVAHPASAAHGLNLQHGGHVVCWTTTTWSSELWSQANARLHRQGQKHTTMVHTIEVPGSVDRHISKRLAGKITSQDDLLETLRSPL